MKPYMAKQPKHVKERVEAKLDGLLVLKLERYCQYLDSDRDYVISQALEIAFRKDKGFAQWLASQTTASPAQLRVDGVASQRETGRRARRMQEVRDSVSERGALVGTDESARTP